MDNAPIHGGLTSLLPIKKLPIYSSEMNPVEYINNKIKSIVRRKLAENGPINERGEHSNVTQAR